MAGRELGAARVSRGKEMREEGEPSAAEGPLILDVGEGGPGNEERVGGHGGMAALAPCPGHCGDRKMTNLRKPPCPFSSFMFLFL